MVCCPDPVQKLRILLSNDLVLFEKRIHTYIYASFSLKQLIVIPLNPLFLAFEVLLVLFMNGLTALLCVSNLGY